MPDRRYVSVDECAEVLGVGRDLIYRLVDEGVLPATKLGSRKVIPMRALELIEAAAMEGFDPDALATALRRPPK